MNHFPPSPDCKNTIHNGSRDRLYKDFEVALFKTILETTGSLVLSASKAYPNQVPVFAAISEGDTKNSARNQMPESFIKKFKAK